MKTNWKKVLRFSVLLIVTFLLTTSLCMPARVMAAANIKDYMIVEPNKDFKKDGKFYLGFKMLNYTNKAEEKGLLRRDSFRFNAKLVNSSGKTIFTWPSYVLNIGESRIRNYGANYSALPKGLYTFILFTDPQHDYPMISWKYNVRVNYSASMSFKSFEKIRNSKGQVFQRFNIQLTNLKGQKLTCKIYDSNGKLVYSYTGKNARKTDNEVGWFQWNGWANVGQKYKCQSGQYTVEIFYTGGASGIQKTFTLIL